MLSIMAWPDCVWRCPTGLGTDPLLAGQAPVVIISELRQIKGDTGYLSPTPVDSLSIHFTFGHHPAEVMACVAGATRSLRIAPPMHVR